MTLSDVRVLTLPWEGVESLRTILGIVDDHDLKVDPAVLGSLETKIDAAPRAMGSMGAGDEGTEVGIRVTMAEADLLLVALRFTDMMSMHLPFYDMVVDTVQFVSDQLTNLWPAEVWMAWRDTQRR